MSQEGMQWAILGVLHAFDDAEELGLPGLRQIVTDERAQDLDELRGVGSIEQMVVHAVPTDPVHRTWLAQTFVVAIRHRAQEAVDGQIAQIAELLLSPFGLGDLAHATSALVDAVAVMEPGAPLSQDALDLLVTAFEGTLVVLGDASEAQVILSGPAAGVATLLVELATNRLTCRSSLHTIDVGGQPRQVVFVEVDVCTNRSFASCRGSIDPTTWPSANPFFQSVQVLGAKTPTPTGWVGVIKEKVGPGINGKVYETDLAITYHEEKDMAVTSFDLAPKRTDPGRVTVDRGFLSCTDEGVHRRIRTLKVYRIEDLDLPPKWICPLWASQLALASWWSAS